MITDGKIRDEKLQHSINREAALSSSEIAKCEYLTGEEILASNQTAIIKQAKFTYSPFWKASVKQAKTIQNQRGKQIKAIEEHGKQLLKSNVFAEKDSLPLAKQNEIFYNLSVEKLGVTELLNDSINFNNLLYH